MKIRWRIADDTPRFKAQTGHVQSIYVYGDTAAECQQRAEFIVRAANSHDKLLAACKQWRHVASLFTQHAPVHDRKTHEEIEAAIARGKELEAAAIAEAETAPT